MAKNTNEKRCRKNIAKLLSLIGFQDDDPETTIKIMRQKLKEIQEKEANVTAAANKNKKLSPNVKKVTFKFGGKTSYIIREKQVEENTNFADIAKKKLSDIKRVANLKFKGESSSSAGTRNYMEIDDSRNHEDDDDDDGVMDLDDFIRSINGTKGELVIEKQLTSSDVGKSHGRLLIPALRVMNPASFLTRDEKWELENKENISVWVFDPKRRIFQLNLGQWNMSEKKNYVLKTQWNQLVSMNGFKENMVIQVLSFRVDQQLCFALVRV